ncbi:MAG TPA: MBL fold metallo-hydrolase [Bacteroidales bacterium]|nr:MBL fold metallo-hydrolase [Bacteroidales bacterium]HQB56470.1 MBL fold metallo-hydrolase [Bacteroidales bacterium]
MDHLIIIIDEHPAPADMAGYGLLTEHGLCIYFEKDGKKWMIDTGASDRFAENATRLGVDIAAVDHLIISHNHYDHTGGLEVFLKYNSRARIHLSEWIKDSRCLSVRNGKSVDIGLDRTLLEDYRERIRWHPSVNMRLSDNVALLANIPARYPVPKANSHLRWICQGRETPDPFHHELALVVSGINTDTVISSCTHKGILNTLDAAFAWNSRPVGRFIGGLHLRDGFEEKKELIAMASTIVSMFPQIHIFAGHCTGDKVLELLKSILADRFDPFFTGARISL